MSGTSLDGLDIACCRFSPQFELIGQHYAPMPEALRSDLLTLQQASINELHLSHCVAKNLVHWFAKASSDFLAASAIPHDQIRALGCHGQTIRHRPADGYSIQLNQPARLAELCGIDVIADFRSRDIAAGGQGAPLVPAFHRALFACADTHRTIVNIGGMANLTNLPNDGTTSGFDCGPGNVLMDAWIQYSRSEPLDQDGRWAAEGTVIPELLQALNKHPFLSAPPPKSCGREEFNLPWLQTLLRGGESAVDVQATLLELTATSIAGAIEAHCKGVTEIYICGGGARNGRLLQRLQEIMPLRQVADTQTLGLPVDAVEAAAFAWLAHAFCEHLPGNIPSVTGARGARILGALYPA